MSMRWIWPLVGCIVLSSVPAQATNYYIAPSGSNSNNGLSMGAPFLTFAYAINAARAWCGDTLTLLNGTYGDGTSTGRLLISSVVCATGNELVVQAQNQRKATVRVANGSGKSVSVINSSYIVLDGLYAKNSDNASVASTDNNPLYISSSQHVTVRNGVFVNPNRYNNSHALGVYYSQDVLLEDNEAYIFNRHCVLGWQSERVVARRIYCNPRGGMPSGGNGPGVGAADALFSMYPCKDCIQENTIADSVTNGMYLTEMNATYGSGVLMSGSKVLGSICIKCRANAIYSNARATADLNHAPQNITIKDIAVVDFNSGSTGIRTSDGVNINISHYTFTRFGGASTQKGFSADDSAIGATPAQASVTITDSTIQGSTGHGFFVSGHNTWSGNNLNSYNNATPFSPAVPSNWGAVTTTNPQLGSCKAWVPDASPLKGAGSGGGDIGANVLYRYIDGVLTAIPLWDMATGAFPFGDATDDGINRVAGESLYDVHLRLNVNTGGCAFPSGYGAAGPADPVTYAKGVGATSANAVLPINPGDDGLLVGVVAYGAVGTVGTINTPVSSCGNQSVTALGGGEGVTTPAYRRVKVFGITNPTSGTCTISVTTSGSIDAVGMVAIRIPVMGSFGTPAVAVNPVGVATATPSVTVGTNTGETVIDFVAGKCVPVGGVCTTTWSVGSDQVWQSDAQAIASDIRLIVSEQDGADGGSMSHTAGQAHLWATVAVPIISGAPDPPSTSAFRVSNYRVYSIHGSQVTPEVSLGPLAPQNSAAEIGATGEFRLRAEILVENAASTETGIHPYCKKVGGSFVSVENGFGAGYVRYYGAGAEPTIPASLTPTTQRFSGTFVPGATSRDSALAVTLPVMAANTRTEIDYQFAAGNGLVAGDVVECEIRRDDGSTLGVHTFPMRVTIVGPRASFGF